MRKVLLLFFLGFVTALALTFSVSAQTVDDPALTNLAGGSSDIPGITCGVADSPFANRCCKVADIKTSTKNLVPDFACLFGACVSDLINIPANVVVGLLGVDKAVEVGQRANANMNPCTSGIPDGNPVTDSCTCKEKTASSKILCDEFLSSNKAEYGNCVACANSKGVWTGLGCMQTNQVSSFIGGTVFSLGLGIAGASTLICILYAAVVLQTSRGNPERIKKARENLRACITGLLLIIFSVFILNLIGVSILRIPGFN